MISHVRRYGNYQLIREIGKGGYGEVFLVEDITTKGKYAMKMLDKEKIFKESLEEDVLSEVRSMKIVNHPHIVRLFEVLKTNKKILLLMEYMSGGDLFDAIKSEKHQFMSEDKARVYFQQIITAVKYLHSKNIIHRDLKPENILVDKENDLIKITDFGLSALINRKDQLLPDIAGTTDYLAPEVIKQTGYLGQSADIWSCGVILFNCVTGNKPFKGSNSVMLNNILTGTVEYPLQKISAALVDLLKRIFEPNPESRFTIQQIMDHEWFLKGFERIKQSVDEYLRNNKEVLSEKNTLKCIDTVYISGKNVSFDVEDIPLMNCFELGAVLYGSTASAMFNGVKSLFSDTGYHKYLCLKGIDVGLNVLKSIFNSNDLRTDFSKTDKDRIALHVLYKSSPLIIAVQLFRLGKEKFFIALSISQGSHIDFIIVMNYFNDKGKGVFEKF